MVGNRNEIFQDPARLLPGDALVKSQEWAGYLAPARSYYLCGLTWFRGNFMRPVDSMVYYRDQMLSIFLDRIEWQKNIRGAEWPTKYNKNQLQDFTNLKNPRLFSFPKALQTITLCEAILEAEGNGAVDPHIVYDHMWIEPAVYYVNGFNHELWTRLKHRRGSEIVNTLKQGAGQDEPALFDEMALNHTVTYATAKAVHDILVELEPDLIQGIGFSGRTRKLFGPSLLETVLTV